MLACVHGLVTPRLGRCRSAISRYVQKGRSASSGPHLCPQSHRRLLRLGHELSSAGAPRIDGTRTVISGLVADQPALHGLLAKIRDLGLYLISVRRLDAGDAGPGAQQ